MVGRFEDNREKFEVGTIMTIDFATLFDISTTQNNLPGKHECPVQILMEYLDFQPYDLLKQTFFQAYGIRIQMGCSR